MESTISATELARKLGDVLGRIRYRGDSFVVERNGEPVARITPLPSRSASTLRDALKALRPAMGDKSAQQKLLAVIKDPDVRDKILAMLDAYAVVKLASKLDPLLPIRLLVNASSGAAEAESIHQQLDQTARRCLKRRVGYLGHVARDP